jgi:aminopeptidase N
MRSSSRPTSKSLGIAGVEVVDAEVREPTTRLTLNAVNMTLDAATIDDSTQAADIALDAGAETATLTFPKLLAAGTHRLRIGFTSRINAFGRGLFYVDYPTDDGVKRMLSSHLEPADARRIFPCWDEPAFKATFALAVTVPRSFLPVSNMPVIREQPLASDSKQVAFARGAGRARRRHGELGRHHLFRKPAAVRSLHQHGYGAARHLRHPGA